MDRAIGSAHGFLRLTAALGLAALLGLAACGGKPPKEKPPEPPPGPPPVLGIEVTALPGANRGPGGQSLPVAIRLYELKSLGAFGRADFFSLYDRESETLGGDLIAREEMTLAPGRSDEIEKPLDPQARYLGAIAAFRSIDGATWRTSVPLLPGKNNRLNVTVGADAIRVEPR